jgi:hypothetical protein
VLVTNYPSEKISLTTVLTGKLNTDISYEARDVHLEPHVIELTVQSGMMKPEMKNKYRGFNEMAGEFGETTHLEIRDLQYIQFRTWARLGIVGPKLSCRKSRSAQSAVQMGAASESEFQS